MSLASHFFLGIVETLSIGLHAPNWSTILQSLLANLHKFPLVFNVAVSTHSEWLGAPAQCQLSLFNGSHYANDQAAETQRNRLSNNNRMLQYNQELLNFKNDQEENFPFLLLYGVFFIRQKAPNKISALKVIFWNL